MTDGRNPYALPGTSRIGRVALRTGSLDRLTPFYRALGLAVDRDGRKAWLSPSDGGGLVLLMEDPEAPARPAEAAGLFHFAIRVPDRTALGDVLGRIRDADLELTGASDHLVSEALYLRDPEGNGVEVYRDRPREDWSETDNGSVDMDTLPLDLGDLAGTTRGKREIPEGTDIGHVHLEAIDLPAAEEFYVDGLGLNVRARYGSEASFLAAGDYHHHVGLNTWNNRTSPADGERGLAWYEFVLPDAETLDIVHDRIETTPTEDGIQAIDPNGLTIRFTTD